ncbi:MAG: branched-chain amino acid ABC transporter permease [Promethearchaeota archaeon]
MTLKNKTINKISKSKNYLTSWIKSFSGALTIFCILFLFILPFLSQEPDFQHYFLSQMVFFFIYAILAASWDLITGIAGQTNFGQSIFFGLSGYIGGALIHEAGANMVVAIIFAVIGTTFIGFLVGIPSLKTKGPYLMLITITLSFIILKLFTMGTLDKWFYGFEGISGLPKLSTDPIIEYFILYISVIISFILLMQITRSKFGTILKSIRDDELGAEASGINTTKYKLLAFMICAAFCGLSGIYYGLHYQTVNPAGNLGMSISFLAIIMAALGGIGSIKGSLIGAFFIVFMEYILLEIGFELNLVRVIFAVILLIVIRFASRGILEPILEHLKQLWDVLLGR